MITEYHFPTPVYIKEIPNAVQLNQYLEQKIIKWSQQDKGVSKTNAGGWHSTTDMNQKEEYNVLTKELFAMHLVLLHPNALFSGVYWIKAPQKSGKFMIYDPRPGVHTNMPSRKEGALPPALWREVHYEPRAGTAVMFPAWLWHEVKPNESNDTRISVSFNFLQR